MDEIEQFIAKHEGLSLDLYQDTVKKFTIGFGRNLSDNGITKAEAIYLLRNDIERCKQELRNYSWFIFQPKGVQMALIDMCFNLGMPGLLKFKNMIEALVLKKYTLAASEALNSKWARQVGQRAKDVAVMISAGE